jgi:UDPglucose 6-dehydrogenase
MKIGFIGLGKLGRDAAEVMSEFYDVEGYDINKVETTVKMVSSIEDCVLNKDLVFIAVPTPHDFNYDGRAPTAHLPPKDFNYEIAKSVVEAADKFMTKNQLLVLISTVLPGTVRREIAPLIKNSRFIYNPYLIAQGTVKSDMKYPEMIIIGTEDGQHNSDVSMLKTFYKKIAYPHDNHEARLGINADMYHTRFEIGTWEEAESIKIFYNTFITAKLCLVNMIQDVAVKVGNMNCDIVANALRDSKKRIMGPQYMKPGLGDGGGCHPRDNIALRSLSENYGLGYDLFDTIVYTREAQAQNMAYFIDEHIPKDMKIIMLGSGFKIGVNQLAGSPVLLVGHYLQKYGRTVEYDVDDNENSVDIDKTQKACYFIGQMNIFNHTVFSNDSIVFDPWRGYELTNCKVISYGNTRK